NNEFPDVYFSSGLGFTLAPTFKAFDYPYYSTTLGSRISDIRTGRDYDYDPSYTVDYSVIDSVAFVRRLVDGKEKLPISNTFLFNRGKDTTCLISKLDTVFYLNVFKVIEGSLQQTSTVNLNRK